MPTQEQERSKNLIIYGREYNLNSTLDHIESVYELTTIGKLIVPRREWATSFLFREPFEILCENMPCRITFYTEKYNRQMEADWLVSRGIITLVGYSRLSQIFEADNITWEKRIDYHSNQRIIGHAVRQYDIFNKFQDYMIPFYSLQNTTDYTHITNNAYFKDKELLNYPFVFSPHITGNEVDGFFTKNKEMFGRFCREREYYMAVNQTATSLEQIPFLVMKKSDNMPNIELDQLNVFL